MAADPNSAPAADAPADNATPPPVRILTVEREREWWEWALLYAGLCTVAVAIAGLAKAGVREAFR